MLLRLSTDIRELARDMRGCLNSLPSGVIREFGTYDGIWRPLLLPQMGKLKAHVIVEYLRSGSCGRRGCQKSRFQMKLSLGMLGSYRASMNYTFDVGIAEQPFFGRFGVLCLA